MAELILLIVTSNLPDFHTDLFTCNIYHLYSNLPDFIFI
jgi:hypothetical protein